jgi:hypothetical protein
MIKRAAFWPTAIIGVLAVTVVANGFLFYEANRSDGAAIESDYYRKAVDWDSTVAQAGRNRQLGWTVDASLSESGRLEARVRSADGSTIEGAVVAVEGFPIAFADGTFSTVLGATGAHEYDAAVRLVHRGLHELRFSVTKGADRYTAVLRGIPGTPFAPKT